MNILHVLQKVFAVLVIAPPLYMGFRYLRWFFRQHQEDKIEADQ